MDQLAAIVNGNNGVFALIILSFVLLFVIIGIKKGLISFKGKGLNIGDHISGTSRIKQLQWDYLQAETEIALRNLPEEYLQEPKKWRTHYVVGKYRDILEQAIIMNNIITDDEYIESKQALAYSAILKATVDPYFKSEDFRKFTFDLTEKIIKQFYKIKTKYEN